MIEIYRRHPWLTLAFLLAAFLALDLAGRFIGLAATRWIDPPALAVEGWMTPRLVVHAFGLPPDELARILGLEDDDTPFRTINQLAEARRIDPKELIAAIEAAIATRPGAAP